MSASPRASAIFAIAAGLAMISCASVRKVGKGSMNLVKNSATATTSTISSIPMPKLSLAGLMPGPKVKVVDVREDDLEVLPSGRERAMAYENERKKRFWVFGGPIDFEEPTLPAPGSEMDGSLLPPRMP